MCAKRFGAPGLWGRIGCVFAGTAAEREWRASHRAELLGIPVPSCLAVGVGNNTSQGSVFLAEFVSNATPLAEFWKSQILAHASRVREASTNSVIEPLALLFASSHERGFLHRDGHPNNVLLQSSPDGRRQALFVDIYGAHFAHGPVSKRQAARSLAQLDQFFHRTATWAQRLRFLHLYVKHRPSLLRAASTRANIRRLARMAVKARQHRSTRLAKQRDRRLMRNGKYFATLRLDNGWSATVALTLERRHLFPEPAVPDRTIEHWRPLLNSLLANVAAAPRIDSGQSENQAGGQRALANQDADHGRPDTSGASTDRPTSVSTFRYGGLDLVVEWSQHTTFWTRFLARFGGSLHKKQFDRCHKLRHRDHHAPLILACAWHHQGMLVDQTALIRQSPLKGRTVTRFNQSEVRVALR